MIRCLSCGFMVQLFTPVAMEIAMDVVMDVA